MSDDAAMAMVWIACAIFAVFWIGMAVWVLAGQGSAEEPKPLDRATEAWKDSAWERRTEEQQP